MENQKASFVNPVPPIVGPSTPPIYVGHVKPSTSPDVDFQHEIRFENKICLDGVHVVPEGISPMGLEIIGRTRPTLQTRPFALVINTVDPNTKLLTNLMSITINGGVQWLPFLEPFRNIPMDNLVFGGDFELMTIIIHGFELPNTPNDGNIGERMNIATDDDTSAPATSELKDQRRPHELKRIISRSSPVLTNSFLLNKKLRSVSYQGKTEDCSYIHQRFSSRPASALVSNEALASLVGEIFSFEQPQCSTRLDFDSYSRTLVMLAERVEDCWKGREKLHSTQTDPFSEVLGIEAANLLATIVVSGFSVFRDDESSPFHESKTAGAFTPQEKTEVVQSVGSAVLRCCSAVLMNEFTAMEFSECGGLSLLIYLIKIQPPLSDPIFLQLLNCFQLAVSHVKLLKKLVEPPEPRLDESGDIVVGEPSGFQSLVYYLAGLKDSHEAISVCTGIINHCALAEAARDLNLLSYTVMNDVAKFAEDLGSRHSSCQRNSVEDVSGEEVESGVEKHSEELRVDFAAVEALYLSMFTKCQSLFLALIESQITTAEESISVINLLKESRVMPSLLALASLARISEELKQMLDWTMRGLHEKEMVQVIDLSASLNHLLSSFLLSLWSLDHCEVLFASSVGEVQLLWDFISAPVRIYSSPPIPEAPTIAELIPHTNNYLCSKESLCWAMWLTGHVTAVFNNITKMLQLPLREEMDDFTRKNLGLGGERRSSVTWQSQQVDAALILLEDLHSFLTLPSTAAVVARVFRYFVAEFCSLLDLDIVCLSHTEQSSCIRVVDSCVSFFVRVLKIASSPTLVQLLTHSTELEGFLVRIDEDERLFKGDYQKPDLKEFLVLFKSLREFHLSVLPKSVENKKAIKMDLPVSGRRAKQEPKKRRKKEQSEHVQLLFPTVEDIFAESSSVKFYHAVKILEFYGKTRPAVEELYQKKKLRKTLTKLLKRAHRGVELQWWRMMEPEVFQRRKEELKRGSIHNCEHPDAALDRELIVCFCPEGSGEDQNSSQTTEAGKESEQDNLNKLCPTLRVLEAALRIVYSLRSVLFSEPSEKPLTKAEKNRKKTDQTNKMISGAQCLFHLLLDVYLSASALLGEADVALQTPAQWLAWQIITDCVLIFQSIASPLGFEDKSNSLHLFPLLSRRVLEQEELLHPISRLICRLIPEKLDRFLDKRPRVKAKEDQSYHEFQYENQNLLMEESGLEKNVVREKLFANEKDLEASWQELLSEPFIFKPLPDKADLEKSPEEVQKWIDGVGSANPLFSHVAKGEGSIDSLILASFSSPSSVSQRYCQLLLLKMLSLDGNAGKRVVSGVVQAFKEQLKIREVSGKKETAEAPELCLLTNSRLSTEKVSIIHCDVLLAMMKTLESSLCLNGVFCVLSVREGFLSVLARILKEESDVLVLISAQQILTSLYRTLYSMAVESESTPDKTKSTEEGEKSDLFSCHLLMVTEMIAELLVQEIPHLMKKFKDSHGMVVLQQGAISLHLLPFSFQTLFLEKLAQIGEGVTVEFLLIKLWQCFDSSYKRLNEVTDKAKQVLKKQQQQTRDPRTASKQTLKDKTNHATDDSLQVTLADAHCQFHTATWALWAVLEVGMAGLHEGLLSAAVFQKALRTNHSDPKKVVVKIQRAYTIWATSVSALTPEDATEKMTRGIEGNLKSGMVRQYSSAGQETQGVEGSVSGAVFDSLFVDADLFIPRHAMLTLCLKLIVELMTKLSKLLQTKTERVRHSNTEKIVSSGEVVQPEDLEDPFLVAEQSDCSTLEQFLVSYFQTHSLERRLSISKIQLSASNMVHREIVRSVESQKLKNKGRVVRPIYSQLCVEEFETNGLYSTEDVRDTVGISFIKQIVAKDLYGVLPEEEKAKVSDEQEKKKLKLDLTATQPSDLSNIPGVVPPAFPLQPGLGFIAPPGVAIPMFKPPPPPGAPPRFLPPVPNFPVAPGLVFDGVNNTASQFQSGPPEPPMSMTMPGMGLDPSNFTPTQRHPANQGYNPSLDPRKQRGPRGGERAQGRGGRHAGRGGYHSRPRDQPY